MKPFFDQLIQKCQSGCRYLKDKKGFSNLELTIMTLILIILICAITDFSKTSTADSSVSSVVNYIAETISEQGGLNTKAPADYKGSYTNTATLLANIEQSMSSIGIPKDQWQLYIDPNPSSTSNSPILIQSNTNTGTFDYKSEIDIIFKYQNSFTLLNQNLPSDIPDLNRSMTRHVITTYHERTNSNITYD